MPAPGKKVYFTSDQHFGAPNRVESRLREDRFVRWLSDIEPNCGGLFVMGDLFDFWHEWRSVVPRGYVRVLGALARLVDEGIPVWFFVGNHDLWMKDYFEIELGIPVSHSKQFFQIGEESFLLAHGDGLGPGDKGFKRMKRIFTNSFFQWAFRWIHPDCSMAVADYLSQRSKLISGAEDKTFLGEEKEYLIQYTYRKSVEMDLDYAVFGHRHLPVIRSLSGIKTKYINLGDWIEYFTFGVYDAQAKKFSLKTYSKDGNVKDFLSSYGK